MSRASRARFERLASQRCGRGGAGRHRSPSRLASAVWAIGGSQEPPQETAGSTNHRHPQPASTRRSDFSSFAARVKSRSLAHVAWREMQTARGGDYLLQIDPPWKEVDWRTTRVSLLPKQPL
jgi:hypothetical protein